MIVFLETLFTQTLLFLRFKISPGSSSQAAPGESKLVSTYRPGEVGDTGVKQREAVDPAIHLLVQHGADTNKKDRSAAEEGVVPPNIQNIDFQNLKRDFSNSELDLLTFVE